MTSGESLTKTITITLPPLTANRAAYDIGPGAKTVTEIQYNASANSPTNEFRLWATSDRIANLADSPGNISLISSDPYAQLFPNTFHSTLPRCTELPDGYDTLVIQACNDLGVNYTITIIIRFTRS